MATETIDFGATLRLARERRKLTLQAVSETTKISPSVLTALENNDIERLPGGCRVSAFGQCLPHGGRGLLGLRPGWFGGYAPHHAVPALATDAVRRCLRVGGAGVPRGPRRAGPAPAGVGAFSQAGQ